MQCVDLISCKNFDPEDEEATAKLSKSFRNVTIVHKGRFDTISDGNQSKGQMTTFT